jgi:hypothetical protein
MLFRKALLGIVFGLAAGLASLGAHAATVTLTDDVDSNPTLDVFSGSGNLGTDSFQFTLHPGTWDVSDIALSFTSAAAPTVALDGGAGTALTFLGTLGPSYLYGLNYSGLSSGLHTLTLGGFTGLGFMTVTASAIPEPESYALMLAGVGALLFMAGRRRR